MFLLDKCSIMFLDYLGVDCMKILGVKMHDRTGEPSDFVEFSLSSVNYIEMWKPTSHSASVPAYHTPNGSYLAISILIDAAAAYRKYGFALYDRSTLVNPKKISELVPVEIGTKVVFKDKSYVIVRNKKLSR